MAADVRREVQWDCGHGCPPIHVSSLTLNGVMLGDEMLLSVGGLEQMMAMERTHLRLAHGEDC